jgi:hypothetical protein
MNLGGALFMALFLGCRKPEVLASEPKPLSLHVQLPESWIATPVPSGLEAGPEGKVVMSMVTSAAKLPEVASLLEALEREKVKVTLSESLGTFVGAQYLVPKNGTEVQAFVAFKQVGSRTVRCASGAASGSDEVVLGYEVCRSLTAQ